MDPYILLGVSRSASIDEINSAYKKLMEKYSEESYDNGPLSDLAAKRRKELETAYDYVIKEKSRAEKDAQQQANRQQEYASANPQYAQVRSFIDCGNIAEAQRILQSMDIRDAEWYYLSGCVAMRSGLYNEAYNFFKTACNKDPENHEYRNAFMRMEQQASQYRNVGSEMQQAQCCNCCSNLICADCCCECTGGDLIPCC